ILSHSGVSPLVGFDVLQQQVNLIRRFNSNVQTPDSVITQRHAKIDFDNDHIAGLFNYPLGRSGRGLGQGSGDRR
ncbi:MAG: hypothetical protein O2817_10145, partial [Proteobacteria bacterium]|nr:hypothetical protein [Pseudomonadota bacterium]